MTNLAVEPVPEQRSDPLFYRILILGLVIGLLGIIGGAIALAFADKLLPDSVVALGGVCAGGLVGLMVPSPVK